MAKRVRLSPDARRAQLIDLGVRMLATRTLEDLSVEALAEQAGISRGLLFHYFRSKQEFHLEGTAPDDSLAPHEQLRTSLSAFIDYVTENRDAYIALVRGAASGDETVRQVFDETRTELANRVLKHLDVLGLPTHPRTEIAVRGWVAFCEEVVITWLSATGDSAVSREELLTLLANALPGVVLNVDPQWITDLS